MGLVVNALDDKGSIRFQGGGGFKKRGCDNNNNNNNNANHDGEDRRNIYSYMICASRAFPAPQVTAGGRGRP